MNGTITISPTCREKLEGWSRTKDDGIENVVLSTDNTPAEIGVGLRLALSQCEG
ncbi:contact-dependent growth inhibition system immunity protein [Klebsiella aerogenes]|uniref:contact-dependent growth inhibition system immunity protein n=1 Tax=Klebsiella aerogenes TaxID=548 RepID=UPI001F434660|nr:contact-dependent growth inhibition system immunity protein [Klebsiella aerogenes]